MDQINYYLHTVWFCRYAIPVVVNAQLKSLSMPKKVARKTVKKSTAKKAPVRKVSRSVPARKAAASMNESALTKRYLHSETEDFYAQHPNVKPLLVLFMLIAISAFIYLIKVRYAVVMM